MTGADLSKAATVGMTDFVALLAQAASNNEDAMRVKA